MKQSIGGRRQRATEAGSDGFGKDFPADEVLCLASRYHDVGEELSQIVHGVIAPRYGNVDSRQGAVFELNHFVARKQCSPVGSPSPARQDVGGKSKTKAQRRIDSFRCFIPPPMTTKEETSDRLTATTEQTPTTRQQEETNVEVQLRFNKIAIQRTPQMAVDKEAICLSRVYSYYPKCNFPLFYV